MKPGNDTLGVGKQSNPKDVIGSKKLPFSVLPWRVLCGVALAMLEGACKYGRHNYRSAGVRASVYFDACVGRHLTSWWEGEDIDPDSCRHHIDKAIAGLMVLRDSMLHGNFTDDRPPRGNVDMLEMNAEAARIIALHADKAPYHFTIADDARLPPDVRPGDYSPLVDDGYDGLHAEYGTSFDEFGTPPSTDKPEARVPRPYRSPKGSW